MDSSGVGHVYLGGEFIGIASSRRPCFQLTMKAGLRRLARRLVPIVAVLGFGLLGAAASAHGPGYCRHHYCPPPPPPPPPSTPVPLGVQGTWTLKFDAEFASGLDTGTWQPGWFGTGITDPVNGFENNCYDSNNVTVANGSLSITARAQQATCPNGTRHPYTSGIISSDPVVLPVGYQFTYGVAEARVYLPSVSTGQINDWPAFWITGQPTAGYPEIDIIEAGGGGSGTYHVHMPSGSPGDTVPGNWTGWHTYSVNWQPGFVRWYWDGVQVAVVTNPVPNTPLFLIVNLGISSGSCCGGPVVVPNTIMVDYVRVWQ
jgi:beta-glucanase (GH16 family)